MNGPNSQIEIEKVNLRIGGGARRTARITPAVEAPSDYPGSPCTHDVDENKVDILSYPRVQKFSVESGNPKFN
jgi:hypothetical protein